MIMQKKEIMTMRAKRQVIIASMLTLGSVLCAAPASAAIWCSGKLAGVYITSGGDVVINGSWRGNTPIFN